METRKGGLTPLYLLASLDRRGDGDEAIGADGPAPSEPPMGIVFCSVVDMSAMRLGSYRCRANVAVAPPGYGRLRGSVA